MATLQMKRNDESISHHIKAICDTNRDECIAFDFIRHCWSNCKINDRLFEPEYLIQTMNEYVHLSDLKREGP